MVFGDGKSTAFRAVIIMLNRSIRMDISCEQHSSKFENRVHVIPAWTVHFGSRSARDTIWPPDQITKWLYTNNTYPQNGWVKSNDAIAFSSLPWLHHCDRQHGGQVSHVVYALVISRFLCRFCEFFLLILVSFYSFTCRLSVFSLSSLTAMLHIGKFVI